MYFFSMKLLPILRGIRGPTKQGHYSHAKYENCQKIILCASAAETRFSVTAESKTMLYIPLQRNTM